MNKLKALFLAVMLAATGAAAAGDETGLVKAIQNNAGAKKVAEMISKGADVNQADAQGVTPLMAASILESTEVAELLLKKGANVNNRSAEGYSPLMGAAIGGHPEMVKLLLDHGAELNVKSGEGLNATHLAALTTIPNFTASMKGNTGTPASRLAVLKLLLERGGETKVSIPNGETLLMALCAEAPVEAIELLLAHGEDVNAKSADGRTALMAAAMGGRADVVKLLLKKGAKRDDKDKDGKTALDYAKDKGDQETMALLK
jgi:ankyrin repeat protein